MLSAATGGKVAAAATSGEANPTVITKLVVELSLKNDKKKLGANHKRPRGTIFCQPCTTKNVAREMGNHFIKKGENKFNIQNFILTVG